MSQNALAATVSAVLVLVLLLLIASIRVVWQYERGVQFRLGRVVAVREPGLRLIIPIIDRLWRVSMRIVTMPIQSQGIITRDNVSVDIAAVAYFRVIDARKSVVVIENVHAAIDQIAQTTLRNVVGQHSLDDVLAKTEVINASIRQILDTTTVEWGVEVTLVELKDIQLPDSMKRAMAREAEAEREKRAKIIAAEGEARAAAALGDASDTMMKHPLALQLRNLQTLAELGVEKNTTIVFPAPLMSAIGELTGFLTRESTASGPPSPTVGPTRRSAMPRRRTERGPGNTASPRRVGVAMDAASLAKVGVRDRVMVSVEPRQSPPDRRAGDSRHVRMADPVGGPRPSRCRLAHAGPADMVAITVDSGDTGCARHPAGSARDCFHAAIAVVMFLTGLGAHSVSLDLLGDGLVAGAGAVLMWPMASRRDPSALPECGHSSKRPTAILLPRSRCNQQRATTLNRWHRGDRLSHAAGLCGSQRRPHRSM